MNNINYQYIVICGNNERKNKTEELINKINRNNKKVNYLKASIPENSSDYICNNIYNFNYKEQKIVCCLNSHLRALKYALLDESPNYSIILEDDITFLKDNYIEIINEILNKWENNELYNNINMIQIGWVPCNNFSYYSNNYSSIDTLNTYNNSKILYTFYAVGAQAYIVKKSNISKNINLLKSVISKNYNELINYVVKNNLINNIDNNVIASDYFLNRIMNFYIVYPPLIIEREDISMLDHNNINNYWNKYFNGYEEEKNKYLNINNITNIKTNTQQYQFIIITVNSNREQKTIELLNKINNNKENIHILKGTTPNDNEPFINCIKNIFNDYEQRVTCCSKSHLRALEYALLDESPNYSIILEDDVTFIKDNFINIVEEIINLLENDITYNNVDMVHIGYIPDKSINTFINKPSLCNLKQNKDFSFYNSFYAFGSQGYIVKKSGLNNIKDIIYSKDFNKFHEIISKYFKDSYKNIGIDHIINRALNFLVVYPPLVIERNEDSTIGNNNKHYLEEYFELYPEQKINYLL